MDTTDTQEAQMFLPFVSLVSFVVVQSRFTELKIAVGEKGR